MQQKAHFMRISRDGSRGRKLPLRVAAVLAWFALGGTVAASPADICLRAAAEAADRTGVPYEVLLAITLAETGRGGAGRMLPWPWTVNMEGVGHWFDTRAEAKLFAQSRHAEGARSFDIGCFQINYRWHSDNFASLRDMFDPETNALYAASFLRRLHAETGDWSAAAGAYHSRTPRHAERYRRRFEEMLVLARGDDLQALPPARHSRSYDGRRVAPPPRSDQPFLRAARPLPSGGGSAALGSLVPLSGS